MSDFLPSSNEIIPRFYCKIEHTQRVTSKKTLPKKEEWNGLNHQQHERMLVSSTEALELVHC